MEKPIKQAKNNTFLTRWNKSYILFWHLYIYIEYNTYIAKKTTKFDTKIYFNYLKINNMEKIQINKSQLNDLFNFRTEDGDEGVVKFVYTGTGRFALVTNLYEIFSGAANGEMGYVYGWVDDRRERQADTVVFCLPNVVTSFEYIFPKAQDFNYKLYFKDRTEYKELFSNGRNKLFLTTLRKVYKSKDIQGLFVRFIPSAAEISNANLIRFLVAVVGCESCDKKNVFNLMPGCSIRTDAYRADEYNGRCIDGDVGAVRYIKQEDNGIYKMKIGKWILSILQNEYNVTDLVGLPLVNYWIETLTTQWKSSGFAGERFTLKTREEGLTFEHIYSTDSCAGKLGSCMMDDEQYVFYENAVDAEPVALYDEQEDTIVARAVVFHNVKDREGNAHNYLERQYAKSDILKEILIDKCYEKGIIDIHKSSSAGYSDVSEIYNKGRERIEDTFLSIDMCIESGDTISFQDTFRFYHYDKKIATNLPLYGENATCRLDTTDRTLRMGEWDEYNEEYTEDELTYVYVWSGAGYMRQTVSEEYAEGRFGIYDGEYYDELYYSEVMDEDIPLDRIGELEEEYKQDNWEWDEYNEEYTDDTLAQVYVCRGAEYRQISVALSYAEREFFYSKEEDAYFRSEEECRDFAGVQITEKEATNN